LFDGRHILRDSADRHCASKKSGSGQPVVELQKPFLHPAAVGVGQRIGRVIADRSDVSEVVVKSLQLQQQRAEVSGASWDVDVQEGFSRLTVGQAMSDGRIAGYAFSECDRRAQRLLLEELFDSTMFQK
jgi:hypothetical protein